MTIERVEYDVAAVAAEVRAARLPAALADALIQAT